MVGEEDERAKSESEVGEEEQGQGRERLAFMLLVTEVFIAPPTHRQGEELTGERGCKTKSKREEEDRHSEKKTMRGRQN